MRVPASPARVMPQSPKFGTPAKRVPNFLFYWSTASFSAFPALKAGILVAGMGMFSPVLG